jgi:hypothetical protein
MRQASRPEKIQLLEDEKAGENRRKQVKSASVNWE